MVAVEHKISVLTYRVRICPKYVLSLSRWGTEVLFRISENPSPPLKET